MRTLRLIRCNWRAIILFELVYRAVLVALALPVYKLAFDGAMAMAGFPYLNHENVDQFMTHPAVIVVTVLVVVVFNVADLIVDRLISHGPFTFDTLSNLLLPLALAALIIVFFALYRRFVR